MQVLQEWRVGDTNLSLVLLAILGKISCLKFCLDGKVNQGFCLKTNLLKMVPQQMIMAQAPWQLTRQGFLQIAFEKDHPCYKELYYQKKKK